MRRPVILDTQLLVLLTVGMTSTAIIPKHKNLTEFTPDDFELLLLLLGEQPVLVLLPNTVSEAANLLRHHREPERGRIMAVFRELLHRNEERYVPSARVADRPEYRHLGVTDAAILALGTPDCEIMTADAALYLAAERLTLPVTNFNHRREDFRPV